MQRMFYKRMITTSTKLHMRMRKASEISFWNHLYSIKTNASGSGREPKNKQVNERELAIGMHEINCMFCLSMTKIVSFFNFTCWKFLSILSFSFSYTVLKLKNILKFKIWCIIYGHRLWKKKRPIGSIENWRKNKEKKMMKTYLEHEYNIIEREEKKWNMQKNANRWSHTLQR